MFRIVLILRGARCCSSNVFRAVTMRAPQEMQNWTSGTHCRIYWYCERGAQGLAMAEFN